MAPENQEGAMVKQRKSGKQGLPKQRGRKNEIFIPKPVSDHLFPQMQKILARGANRPSGHSPKKK